MTGVMFIITKRGCQTSSQEALTNLEVDENTKTKSQL
jgi:hypothetical protein